MTDDVDIKLVHGRATRGSFPVTLMRGEEVLLAGRVNPHKVEDIEAFIRDASARLPGIADQAESLRAQLLQLAAPRPAETAALDTDNPYTVTDGGLIYMKPTANGPVPQRLTNFSARIVADVVKDDGAEREHAFEIVAGLAGREQRFTIPASQFSSMNWPIECLGAGAIVHPGMGTRDHARTAIQLLSPDLTSRVIYTHTGWREIDDRWAFLHAGGAIGTTGPVAGVEVHLPDSLSAYLLPEPPSGDHLRGCITASMSLIELAPPTITVPVFCAIYRAPLGSCDMAGHLSGPSGAFKTELAALANQHFGPGLDARHLPGQWSSTDNALEGLAFAAKDVLLTVDDFAPGGTPADTQRLHQKADRIIRAQGNHSGRQRMRADGSLRPVKPPRGMILSTGEDIPRGLSLRARMWINEVGPGDIDPAQLDLCQANARTGLYAGAMAGYVQWLAGRIAGLRAGLKAEIAELRARAATSAIHRRTPEIIANLMLGLRYFLAYARDAGALDERQVLDLEQRAWTALGDAAGRQQDHHAASEPTQRFIELITSALASGRAHLAGPEGNEPRQPEGWGWRRKPAGSGLSSHDEWQPQGARIGWVEGEDVYLDSDSAYQAAQGMASGGDGIVITVQTLRKRLGEKGLLIREGKRDELTVRRRLEGVVRRVLSLTPGALLCGEPAKPAIPAMTTLPTPETGGSMAGSADPIPKTRHQNPPPIAVCVPKTAPDGGNGGNGGLSRGDTAPGAGNRERITL